MRCGGALGGSGFRRRIGRQLLEAAHWAAAQIWAAHRAALGVASAVASAVARAALRARERYLAARR